MEWTHVSQGDIQLQGTEPTRLGPGKESSPRRIFNWLTDDYMLPSVLPWARVLRYGYRLLLLGCGPEARLDFSVIAKNLLRCLTAERKDCLGRPLIFIGHTWGGIIIEHALVAACRPTEEAEPIKDSTSGIIFLATLVKGSDTAVSKVAEQIKLIPKDSLFDKVRARSEHLADLLREFTSVIKQRNERPIPLVCLYLELKRDPTYRKPHLDYV